MGNSNGSKDRDKLIKKRNSKAKLVIYDSE
jgi:hypothetical protein